MRKQAAFAPGGACWDVSEKKGLSLAVCLKARKGALRSYALRVGLEKGRD